MSDSKRSFVDSFGRTFLVRVDVAAMRRVKQLTGIDLAGIVFDEKLAQRLVVDIVLLVDVLYAVCKPQADSLSLTDEQFGEGLAGDAIDHATDALVRAIADFFPARKSQLIHRALDAKNKYTNAVLDRLDQMEDAALVGATPPVSGDSSTSAPDSLDATPPPGPLAN